MIESELNRLSSACEGKHARLHSSNGTTLVAKAVLPYTCPIQSLQRLVSSAQFIVRHTHMIGG